MSKIKSSIRLVNAYCFCILAVSGAYFVFSFLWLLGAYFRLIKFRKMLITLGQRLAQPNINISTVKLNQMFYGIYEHISKIQDMWSEMLIIASIAFFFVLIGVYLLKRKKWAFFTMCTISILGISFFLTSLILDIYFPSNYNIFNLSDSALTLLFSLITISILGHPIVRLQFFPPAVSNE